MVFFKKSVTKINKKLKNDVISVLTANFLIKINKNNDYVNSKI